MPDICTGQYYRKIILMKNHCASRFAFALAVVAGAPALAAPLPGGAGSLQETYQDWTVSCQTQNDTAACLMRQDQSSSQTGQRMLTVELRSGADGKADGVILLPFGLDLARGAALTIDEAEGPALSYSTCLPQGCLAPVHFDARQTAALKKGETLNLTATALSPSQPVAFKVSLKGFGAALDRIVALTK